MISTFENFALWQLAEGLATASEQAFRDAVTASANDAGLRPTALHLEIADALRQTARKLGAGLGFGQPAGDSLDCSD
jgi:hypothetical protein